MKLRLFLFLSLASSLLAASENVVAQKPDVATEYTEASRAHFGVWTDPQWWKLNPHPTDLFSLQFMHLSPTMAGVLNAEATTVPFERLPQSALEHGRTVFTNFNIVSQEQRRVCGKDVLFLVMEGLLKNKPYTVYGYYYTGPEGTVQCVVFFEDKELEACKGRAFDFLNGLQIGQPGAASTSNKRTVRSAANSATTISSAPPGAMGVTNVDIQALNATVPYHVYDAELAKLKAFLTGDPTTVANRLQPGAAKKNPLAMFLLAQLYASGKGVPADAGRAVDLMKQAAAAGLPAAEIALGSWYENGYQVPKDWKEAERLLRKPADAGSPEAEARLGEILMATDPSAGADFLRKAAGRGFAAAEYRLASCYAKGTGVERNAEEEMKWLMQSAQHGNMEAKETLGECYMSGHGVPRDPVEAVKCFTDAAKGGVPGAQNNLGASLMKGEGTPTDRPHAVEWFRKAAEHGLAEAQKNLGYAYAHALGISTDLKQAVYWYEKAAKQGQAEAQFWTGIAYLHGTGVEKDVPAAMDWLHKAADQNLLLAAHNLGAIYWHGTEVPQDKAEAVKWFRRAAEGGDGKSQEMLSFCYYRGDGVEKDSDESVKWVRKAAETGLASAQLNLGTLYMNGLGTLPKNVSEGMQWIRKAAEQGNEMAEFRLGIAYERGQGVEVSPEEGARWFRFAAIHGNPFGQNAFGYALATGEGVKQDLVEAYKWYVLAMAQKEADPKARAEVNKNAIVPKMTPEQIKEGEQRAAAFVSVKEKAEDYDPFSIDAA
jgi:uncharacterized protein